MTLDRYDFGGTSSDFVYSITTGGLLRLASADLTMWEDEVGGDQITDLLWGGSPTSIIPTAGDGQIPTFQGPAGVTQMWVSAGGATRVLIVSQSGIAERSEAAAADALDARTDAETARDQAQGFAGTSNTQVSNFIIGSGPTKDALSAAIAASKAPLIDAYTGFFGGPTGVFVTGQSTTNTTLTGTVSAGATVLPVASAAGLSAGVMLLTDAGTSKQQIHRVVSIASLNVTVAAPVTNALANGATVAPLWTNSSHLGTDGWNAFAYYLANAKDSAGAYVIPTIAAGKRYTFLGNSWFANGGSVYATQVQARYPGATVTNAGVTGNKSAQLLARFDTDVPSTSAVVIMNEPGINDAYDSTVGRQDQARTMEALAAKCRAIGALPIFITPPPLLDQPTRATTAQQMLTGALANAVPKVGLSGVLDVILYQTGTNSQALGRFAQQVSTGVNNTAFGYGAQAGQTTGAKNTAYGALTQNGTVTGAQNTAVGDSVQVALTSGNNNTAFGQTAQRNITTGSANTAVGQGAQNALTTSNFNTAIGNIAQLGLISGTGNTAIGYGAQYSAAGVAGNATTTGSYQTSIGYQSGQGSATQVDYITTIGYRTTATASGGVAIGNDSTGTAATATSQNDFVLGTANHKVRVPGKLTTAAAITGQAGFNVAHGATPTTLADGDIWTTTAGMFVRINGTTKTVTLT